MPKFCTKSEYARLLGVSPSAVSHMRTSGVLVLTAAGKVNVDESNRRRSEMMAPAPVEASASRSGGGAPGGSGIREMGFPEARLANLRLQVRARQLKVERLQSELISREFVETRVSELSRQARASWALWPSRVSERIAAALGVKPHDVRRELETAVRENLEASVEAKF